MNPFGRVAVCGFISSFNETEENPFVGMQNLIQNLKHVCTVPLLGIFYSSIDSRGYSYPTIESKRIYSKSLAGSMEWRYQTKFGMDQWWKFGH